MAEKFQNLTVDYRKLMSVPIQDRVLLAKSASASDIFGNMTPTEISRLFPSFYQNKLSSVGGFSEKALSGYTSSGSSGGGGSGAGGGGFGQPRQGSTGQDIAKPITPPSVGDAITMSVNEKKFGNRFGPPRYKGPAFEALKEEIARGEGDYGAYNRGTAGDTPTKMRQFDVTKMSIAEVLELQAGGPARRKMFAVGKYQFIPNTLKEAVQNTGIDTSLPFDAATQEKLFEYLVSPAKRPRLAAYLDGRSDNVDAALDDLASEFASIPDNSGSGKYDRDSAGNKAFGGTQRAENIKNILQQVRVDQTKNPHDQESTDAGIVPMSEPIDQSPKTPSVQITPENIGTIEGLDPRVVDHVKSLTGAEQAQFLEKLNYLGSPTQINESLTKAGVAARVGSYTPQSPVVETKIKPVSAESLQSFYADRSPRTDLDRVMNVDPDLLKSYAEAIQQYEASNPNYRVELFGPGAASRSSGSTANHGVKADGYSKALDFVIIDKNTGQQITNLQEQGYEGQTGGSELASKEYTRLHALARLAQEYYAPHEPDLRQGGGFRQGVPADWMHGDITGGGMAAYSWQSGYSPDYINRYNIKENLVLGDEENIQKLAREIYGQRDEEGNYVNAASFVQKDDGNTTILPQKVEPPNPHIVRDEKGNVVTDAGTVPISEPIPQADTTTIAPKPEEPPENTPAMKSGGFIPEQDNLAVVKQDTGETVAKINEGELKGGIREEGSGLRVESNVSRRADDYVNKYEAEPEEDAPQAPQPQQQAAMTPPKQSEASQHIAHIPSMTTLELMHGSLVRAYDINLRRTGYGNIS